VFEVDSSDQEWSSATGSCEHSKGSAGSMNGVILRQISDCQFHNDGAAWGCKVNGHFFFFVFL
jgi:hypothetical protein